MPASKQSPDPDSILSEIHIAAPPDRVFQALIDPRQVPQWWGEIGVYRCTDFFADPRVGGKWHSRGLDGGGRPFEITGVILEIDPPRVLAYSWVATWTGDAKTTVRWELERTEGGTLVRIRHSGFAAHPELTQAYRGWPRMLGWLAAFVENNETVESRAPASRG